MTDLARILDAGLGWLYDTTQPDDAHVTHHGITIGHPEANRWYVFTPDGAQHLPTVIVNVSHPEWIDNGFGQPSTLANPLAPDELPTLAEELRRRGFDVASTWNGHPGDTGSVGLVRPAHPSLVAAVQRYHRGCTVHPQRSVFCDCEEWTAAYRRAVKPPYLTPAASA